jgi:hypothetical protein
MLLHLQAVTSRRANAATPQQQGPIVLRGRFAISHVAIRQAVVDQHAYVACSHAAGSIAVRWFLVRVGWWQHCDSTAAA